jgi:NAD+ kinase
MKVSVFARNPQNITPVLLALGFQVVENDADFVVTLGGDGTIVHAEHAHPGVPKIILKESAICKKCKNGVVQFSNEEILERVKNGAYTIEKLWKIEASVDGKTLVGLNDITVHNGDPRHAIRYDVFLDGEIHLSEVIGDGVVVSTPFGSTGYYRSITDSYFETGLGLAFNNSTEQADHVVLGEQREITLQISRGPASVYADNQQESLTLETGMAVIIKKGAQIANIVRVNEKVA